VLAILSHLWPTLILSAFWLPQTVNLIATPPGASVVLPNLRLSCGGPLHYGRPHLRRSLGRVKNDKNFECSRYWGWNIDCELSTVLLLGGCAGPSWNCLSKDRSPARVNPDPILRLHLNCPRCGQRLSGPLSDFFDWRTSSIVDRARLRHVKRSISPLSDGEVQARVWTLTPDGE